MAPPVGVPIGFLFRNCNAINGGNAIANGDIGDIPGDAIEDIEGNGEPVPSGFPGRPPGDMEGIPGTPFANGLARLEENGGVGEFPSGKFEAELLVGAGKVSCAGKSAAAINPSNKTREVARHILRLP